MNISKKLLLLVSLPLLLASGAAFAGKKGKKTDKRPKLTSEERASAKARGAQKKASEVLKEKTEQLKILQEEKKEVEQIQAIGNDWLIRFQRIVTLLDDEKNAQHKLGLTHIQIQKKNKTGEIPKSTLQSYILNGGDSAYINYITHKDTLNNPNATAEQIQIKLLGSGLKNLQTMSEVELNRLLQTTAFFMQSKNEAINLYGIFAYSLVKINLLSEQKNKLEPDSAQWEKCEKSKHPIFKKFFKAKYAVSAALDEKNQFEQFALLIQKHLIDSTQTRINELSQKINLLEVEISGKSPTKQATKKQEQKKPTILKQEHKTSKTKAPIQQKENWAKLEKEPLALILNHLDHDSFEACEKTCKNWQAVVKSVALNDIRKNRKNEKALSTTKDGLCVSQDNPWLVKIETPWADYIFYKLHPQPEMTQLTLPPFDYDETPGRPGSYVGKWDEARPEWGWENNDATCERLLSRRHVKHRLLKAIPHIADYLLESDDLIFEGTYKDRRNRDIPTKSIIGCIVPKVTTEDGAIIMEQGIDCIYEWGFIPTADPAARPICYHRCARAVPSAMQLEREVVSREENTTLPENWDAHADFPKLP